MTEHSVPMHHAFINAADSVQNLKKLLSESARWIAVTLEHFEKFKMASKMATILVFQP